MAQAFDRSKFKATSTAELKKADSDNGNADFFKIVEGENRFRIYPYHPDGGGNTFAELKETHWLEIEVPVYENGKKTDKVERKGRSIFNSITHGGTPKDIIEEYINFAKGIAKDNFPNNQAEQDKFLDPIIGGFKSQYDGIVKQQKWTMYVDKLGLDGSKVFGQVEIGKAVKFRLNTLAANEASSDPLGTDPFTDLVDGRAINITYNKNASPQEKYKTEFYAPLIPKGGGKITLFPISDEDLEKFMKVETLAKRFRNNYKLSDFDKAMNGLKYFDDKYKIGVFAHEAFMDIAEEISKYYPEPSQDEQQKEDQKNGQDINKMFTAPKVTNPEADTFDEMDRQELKDFCKEQKTGIIVMNNTSDDEIRNKLREWYNSLESGKKSTPKEVPVKSEEKSDLPWENGVKSAPEKKAESKVSTADRLAALRSVKK